jgi:hypothetical protein
MWWFVELRLVFEMSRSFGARALFVDFLPRRVSVGAPPVDDDGYCGDTLNTTLQITFPQLASELGHIGQ